MPRGTEFFFQIYKYVPPDQHELIVSRIDDIAAADWKVYQLDANLSLEEKERGIFHYRWIQFDNS